MFFTLYCVCIVCNVLNTSDNFLTQRYVFSINDYLKVLSNIDRIRGYLILSKTLFVNIFAGRVPNGWFISETCESLPLYKNIYNVPCSNIWA